MSLIRLPQILLFSMPRSGSTWVGKILDSHPDTIYRHEPDTAVRFNGVPAVLLSKDRESVVGTLKEFINRVYDIKTTRTCGKQPLFDKSYLPGVRPKILIGSLYAAKILEGIFGISTVFSPDKFSDNVNYPLVWKSVISLGRLPIINEIIPEAQKIVLVRHPCGQIASVLAGEKQKKFTASQSASEDYWLLELLLKTDLAQRKSLDMDSLKSISPVERLAWQWTLFNEYAHSLASEDANMQTILYDKVCLDPVGEVKKLFDFCDLDWNEQTARFLDKSTGLSNDAYYSVYKNPLQSSEKWKKQLSQSEIKMIMDISEQSEIGRLFGVNCG